MTAPNLEDCGLLRFEYEGLKGADGLLGETELWSRGFSIREDRNAETFIETPVPLQLCPPEVARRAGHARCWTSCVGISRSRLMCSTASKQRDLVDQTQPRLLEGTVWYLDELASS